MSESAKEKKLPKPLHVALKRDENGQPYMEGVRCGNCGYTFVGARDVCAKCSAQGQMDALRLAETGTLYVYTIVHRSFPGADTPFIDVIVDLDDGSHLKGVLKGVEPEPDKIEYGLPVELVYEEVVPPNTSEPYLAYHFVPRES